MCDEQPAQEKRSLQEERDLEEVQRLSELFKFYLELVLKIFVATLGIAGGVTSFVLGKEALDPKISALGLLLPAVLCIGVGFGLLGATFTSFKIDSALRNLKKALNLRLVPHGFNLIAALIWFGIVLTACGVVLLVFSGQIYTRDLQTSKPAPTVSPTK